MVSFILCTHCCSRASCDLFTVYSQLCHGHSPFVCVANGNNGYILSLCRIKFYKIQSRISAVYCLYSIPGISVCRYLYLIICGISARCPVNRNCIYHIFLFQIYADPLSASLSAAVACGLAAVNRVFCCHGICFLTACVCRFVKRQILACYFLIRFHDNCVDNGFSFGCFQSDINEAVFCLCRNSDIVCFILFRNGEAFFHNRTVDTHVKCSGCEIICAGIIKIQFYSVDSRRCFEFVSKVFAGTSALKCSSKTCIGYRLLAAEAAVNLLCSSGTICIPAASCHFKFRILKQSVMVAHIGGIGITCIQSHIHF